MKKRVLHLLNTNKFSGAENVVCTIIKNMSDKYDMIYCSPNGTISKVLENENITYYPLKKLSYSEVKKAIKTLKPDIIHAHDNRATVIASLFANKCKIISHIHGNNKIMNSLNLKTLLFNIISKKIDKFIWVSDSSFDDYYFKNKLKSKSTILYNVIDKNKIYEKSNLYKCNETYDLIFLGRLGYPKNPERLIEIIKHLKNKRKNISVAIVGDGIDREKIEHLIEMFNLKNNTKLYGFQNNPYPILKQSKILIVTSIYEGTPMCALEAQSLGKPIVATPVDGLKKIIINEKNGFLNDSNKKMCDFIIDILNNEKKYQNLSNNSVNFFNKYNNLNKYCQTIKVTYEE